MTHVRLIVSLFFAVSAAIPSAWALPGYRLHQVSDFYGESVSEVSPKSMRLQSSRLALTLHVASPSFGMTAINDKNQQFSEIPLKQWTGFVLNQKKHQGQEYVTKRGTVKICGMDADEYWIETNMRAAVTNKSRKELWYNGRSYNTHYYVSKTILPPYKCYQIFTNALGMPVALGFPVRMIQFNPDGRAFTTFDTRRIDKADVSDKLAIPKAYARAADEMGLLLAGSADTAAIASILDDEDLDTLTPAKKDGAAAKRPAPQRQQIRGWVPGMDVSAENAPASGAKRARGNWTPGG
jgi:hypothetical protein